MAIIIKPKRSGSSDSVPTTGDLADGEIAINTADKKIYARSSSSIVNLGTGTTASAAELNIMDGGTSATSTTVADADRVILNDNGTMVQVAVTDLAAYFDDEITAMPNLVTTAATTVGALNSGSITSGFGTIDTGASTITTTGLISGGSLDIDDVLINGTTIGHTNDSDLMTLADGILTVAGRVDATNDIKTDAIRRYSDSSTTTKILLNDEVIKFNAGHSSKETLKIQNNLNTATVTITDGVDDTGYDVKFFGATSGAYLLWDESDNSLETAGAATINVVKDKLLIAGAPVTTTAAELNVLDGITASTSELNSAGDGVTTGKSIAMAIVFGGG